MLAGRMIEDPVQHGGSYVVAKIPFEMVGSAPRAVLLLALTDPKLAATVARCGLLPGLDSGQLWLGCVCAGLLFTTTARTIRDPEKPLASILMKFNRDR